MRLVTGPAPGVPTQARAPAARTPRSWRPGTPALVALGAAAVAIVVAVVVALSSGGGGAHHGPSTASLFAVRGGEQVLSTRAATGSTGIRYRVAAVTDGRNVFVSLAVAGRTGAFRHVDRIKLPDAFTSNSRIVELMLDRVPGSTGAQVAVSWFVHSGDRTDVTHYVTAAPTFLSLDS